MCESLVGTGGLAMTVSWWRSVVDASVLGGNEVVEIGVGENR
jgi:hypothetical protein